MKYKVSIIVPVYNVEKYLRECLDSLVNQTLKEVEIICINDASPDNSLKILKEYKKNYPNLIRVIDLKQNVFPGGARNRGLDVAQGEYIAFVDSDDYVDVTMCEKLYGNSKKHNADIVQFNYVEFRDNNKRKKIVKTDSNLFKSGDLAVSKEDFISKTHDYLVVRFYKKYLWDKVRFPEGSTYEDSVTFFFLVLLSKKIIKFDRSFYFYRRRSGSITASRPRVFSQIDGMKFMIKQARKLLLYDKYKSVINLKCVGVFFGVWSHVNSAKYGYKSNQIDRVREFEKELSKLVHCYKNILLEMNMPSKKRRDLNLYFNHPVLYRYWLNVKSFFKKLYYFKRF